MDSWIMINLFEREAVIAWLVYKGYPKNHGSAFEILNTDKSKLHEHDVCCIKTTSSCSKRLCPSNVEEIKKTSIESLKRK